LHNSGVAKYLNTTINEKQKRLKEYYWVVMAAPKENEKSDSGDELILK
jgi:hypothetical protein